MGKGIMAIRVADWFLKSQEYELTQIVPVIPEPAWIPGSLVNWSIENKIPLVESGHYKDISGVKSPGWNVDLAISLFYDRIIEEWYISKCKRIINMHNSPLPKYRGVSPINWALKNGEKEHGVTIHEITKGIDDGPIIAQIKHSIYPQFDEVIDVYNRALEYGWVLFQQTMPILDKIESMPQDNSIATYYNSSQNSLLGERKYYTKKESLSRLYE